MIEKIKMGLLSYIPIRVHITAPENGDWVFPPYEPGERRDPYIVRFQWWKKLTMLAWVVMAVLFMVRAQWGRVLACAILPYALHAIVVAVAKYAKKAKEKKTTNEKNE